MLPIDIRIFGNPYDHTVPNEELLQIIKDIAIARRRELEEGAMSGEFKRSSIAFALLDPTAPNWRPSNETLMAIVTIGVEAEDYVVNAVAKAFEDRDHGCDCGTGAYVNKQTLADGDFRWGFSANVAGTRVGASALLEIQDRCLAEKFAADFNYRVARARATWEEARPQGKWFCNKDAPEAVYSDAASRTDAIMRLDL